MKKLIAWLITMVIILAFYCPLAKSLTIGAQGTWGELSWRVECTNNFGKHLIISGTGSMSNPKELGQQWYPWKTYNDSFSSEYKINQLTIEDGVTSISNRAFSDMDGLRTVNIGKGVTSIGDSAFEQSYGSLNPVRFLSFSSNNVMTYIGKRAFSYCEIKGVSIPSSVLVIDDGAFSYCSDLTSVRFGSNLETIGISAFYGCNLKEISVPDSVTYIGNGAFFGNKDLISAQIDLPADIAYIGNNAFTYRANSHYENIVESPYNTLTAHSLGRAGYSFKSDEYGCKIKWLFSETDEPIGLGVEEVTVDGEEFSFPEETTEILVDAFNGNSISRFVVPEGIVKIGSCAFGRCKNLKTISLPRSLKSIESSAFGGCSSLESITLPDNMESISATAFSCSFLGRR